MIRICHLSDIHWRGISRHTEYTDCFERLFVQLKDLKPDIIINTGDTFHTKTSGITPEIIERLAWTFRSLAEIAPSYTILGNHDGNLTNLSRKDIITPIHETMMHPRAHLLKKTGVYNVQEIKDVEVNLCVFSPFDLLTWDKLKPSNAKSAINIALYHGPVEESITETGWTIDKSHNTNKVSLFDVFDFALL